LPNLLSLSAFRVGSELRSLPSAGITRHPRYYEPLRHPLTPALSVTGYRLVDALGHARGFPCCIGLPLVCMLSPLPRRNRKVRFPFTSLAVTAFPEIVAGRLPHCVFRGLLSVHSRYGLHTCQVTDMTLYTGGFSRFVTSTTAPIATGWNESCRAGFAPAGKPCLCTAHTTEHARKLACRSRRSRSHQDPQGHLARRLAQHQPHRKLRLHDQLDTG
jgi:hypothetical protein